MKVALPLALQMHALHNALMHRPFSTLVALLTACLFLNFARAAQDPIDRGTFSVYFENDLFTGTDRFYTNGTRISWSSADLENYSDTPYASPLLPLIRVIPFVNNPDYQKNLVFSFGQNIYTPDDTVAFDVVEGDRPYAGWLYAGFGLAWKTANVRNSLVFDIGVVGSYAYGEEAQRLVHEARNLDVPNGWDNQLHNEIGFVGVYTRTWRWPVRERRVGIDWELLPHAGAALGNVATYANAGAEFRIGVNLPDDFGTAPIGPGTATSTPVEGRQQADRAKKFDLGAYLFARADGRVVAHNIFIDGNTFGDSHSVGRKWLVADLSVGASLNYKNTKLTYAVVYRSKEFDGQEEGQLFGSISVNFAF